MSVSLRDSAVHGLNRLWYGGSRLCWLLWPLAIVFRGLVAARRSAYRRGWLDSCDVGVPVVVVGNLTAGGAGKTPLTIWLGRRLSERGARVGIVCRGYGGTGTGRPRLIAADADVAEVGDEAKLLARRTGCPVATGRDRVGAAGLLVREAGVQLIVADDGLQHYRLRRSFEIAVIDGTRGLGNGLCLPAGPLREPRSRLADVDAIVVNEASEHDPGTLKARLAVVDVVSLTGAGSRSLEDFRGQSVHAVAAIGNPQRFFAMLERAGLAVSPHARADHAGLDADDIRFSDGAPVLITEKDAVKLADVEVENVWVVMVALRFSPGDGERLLESIDRRVGRPDASP